MTFDTEQFALEITSMVCRELAREVEQMLLANPELPVGSVIDLLRQRAATNHPKTLEERSLGDCSRCGRPVARRGDTISHLGPEGVLSSRGCRAASFDWLKGGEGWDDTLNRSWIAVLG